jgi:predicted aspartyl protease
MIGYDSVEFEPAAPVADVEVSNPVTYAAERGKAKIDSGADISVVPDAWAAKLHLLPAGLIEVASFDGRIIDLPTYYVNISTNGFRFELVKVLSSQRTNALLGRDILNGLKITLDGKSLAIQVSDP